MIFSKRSSYPIQNKSNLLPILQGKLSYAIYLNLSFSFIHLSNYILFPTLSLPTRAVAFLHSQTPPLLHLDLKSLNVLVDSDYNAKLADFGESRKLNSASNDNSDEFDKLITKSQMKGTIYWMAPEVSSTLSKDQSYPNHYISIYIDHISYLIIISSLLGDVG